MRRSDALQLGVLCRRGHDHEMTGKSLRYTSGHCVTCFRDARALRFARNPEAMEKERMRQKTRDAARPRVGKKEKMTIDQRRAMVRLSKAKARSERHEETKRADREYYQKNSLRIRIRNRVSKALRSQGIKKVMTVDGYGIDVAAIIAHIGPCPGPDWHIDHLRPLAWFDLSDPNELMAAFSPENHQWLPAFENMKKGARYASIRAR